jgi:hypothetical protein
MLLLGITWKSAAQSPAECKTWLMRYVDSFEGLQKPGKQPYFLHMSVTTVPAKDSPYTQASYPSQDIDVKIYASASQLAYESTYMAFYQDARETYTVVHPSKQILKSASAGKIGGKGETQLSAQLSVLKRAMIEKGRLASCKETSWNGKPVQELVLVLDAQNQQALGMRQITYVFNTSYQQVIRQTIEYMPGHRYLQQTIVFYQIDTHYRGHFPANASAHIYTGGKLADRYRGYTVEVE